MGKKSSFNRVISTAVVTMFSLGMYTVSPESAEKDVITNYSFKSSLDGWTVKGNTNAANWK
ncbi:hypothetical protein, partial [Clostridium sp. CAG:265]